MVVPRDLDGHRPRKSRDVEILVALQVSSLVTGRPMEVVSMRRWMVVTVVLAAMASGCGGDSAEEPQADSTQDLGPNTLLRLLAE